MEETENKLSYEQLKEVALQLQSRANTAEQRLNMINLTTLRLEYIFKIFDKEELFPDEFINTCVKEVMDMMGMKTPEGGED